MVFDFNVQFRLLKKLPGNYNYYFVGLCDVYITSDVDTLWRQKTAHKWWCARTLGWVLGVQTLRKMSVSSVFINIGVVYINMLLLSSLRTNPWWADRLTGKPGISRWAPLRFCLLGPFFIELFVRVGDFFLKFPGGLPYLPIRGLWIEYALRRFRRCYFARKKKIWKKFAPLIICRFDTPISPCDRDSVTIIIIACTIISALSKWSVAGNGKVTRLSMRGRRSAADCARVSRFPRYT